jgi:hypothetical protein
VFFAARQTKFHFLLCFHQEFFSRLKNHDLPLFVEFAFINAQRLRRPVEKIISGHTPALFRNIRPFFPPVF